MFTVKHKETGENITVYSVRHTFDMIIDDATSSANSYMTMKQIEITRFLIYDGEWRWINSEDYVPGEGLK